MSDLRSVIGALYVELDAPGWAAPNLDALADVLRDLSWLPEGPVELTLPDLTTLPLDDGARLLLVLLTAQDETSAGPRPVRLQS